MLATLAVMAGLLALGILALTYTRKRKPFVLDELKKNPGTPQTVDFGEDNIVISSGGAELTVPVKLLVAQYIAGRHYVAYLAVKPHRLLAVPITEDTRDKLDEAASYYVKHRIPLKRLRV